MQNDFIFIHNFRFISCFHRLYRSIRFKIIKNRRRKKDDDDEYVPLSLWKEGEPKTKLKNFMEKISNIPKEDRVAVFDLDGTLFQETDPVYDDWKLYYYRVYNDSTFDHNDPNYSIYKKIADEISIVSINGSMPDYLNLEISMTYGEIFKDMTLEQYTNYIKDFVNEPAEGYTNLKRGDAFYKPMIELIEYLQKNDFNVFITSGTDRYQVRTVIEGHINIPKSNVIGSDYEIRATKQGNETGNNYEYNNNDTFSFEGSFLRKNLKTNKVSGIIREIGKQPVLAFGNSGGDSSMANYVLDNNKYDSLAFMVLCDDLDRENGNKAKADDMREKCKQNNWIPISMRDDWKTIYGENVQRIK